MLLADDVIESLFLDDFKGVKLRLQSFGYLTESGVLLLESLY